MKAVIFDLCGKMAHFRKYYSNSTALSYLVPPLATVKGLLAGLLGYERDSYYTEFSNAHCKIGIAVKSPIKKLTQTMNLLQIKSLNDLAGQNHIPNHVQNHTEYVVPKDIRKDYIRYEIIVYHDKDTVMDKLETCICGDSLTYTSQGTNLFLGSAQCPGWIENGRVVDVMILQSKDMPVELYGAVSLSCITKICIGNEPIHLFKEESITEFDEYRRITQKSKKDILLGLDDRPMQLLLKQGVPYFVVQGRSMMFVE